MKALVAGAGIAGLATGIALCEAGVEVEIVERSRELREIGAGLMIWPNGTRALKALGVDVRRLVVNKITLADSRGRRLTEMPVDSARQRYGSNVSFVRRADLQAALANRFGLEGIRLGSQVDGFVETDGKVVVTFQGGESTAADLLVGADGLRSAVRRQLLGDGDPTYLGSTIWRGLAPGEAIELPTAEGMNWWGRGAEFLAFHLPDGTIYWAGVTKEPRGETPGPKGHKIDLLERFGSWTQPVPGLISATEDSAILRNDMYDRSASPRWSGGRVTLVGDAAHPMSPNQGQGACQALEDAVALGASVGQTSNLSDAFRLYERRRLRRANRVVALSRQGTRGVQIDNPLLCAFRDAFMSLIPRRIIMRALDGTLAADTRERR